MVFVPLWDDEHPDPTDPDAAQRIALQRMREDAYGAAQDVAEPADEVMGGQIEEPSVGNDLDAPRAAPAQAPRVRDYRRPVMPVVTPMPDAPRTPRLIAASRAVENPDATREASDAANRRDEATARRAVGGGLAVSTIGRIANALLTGGRNDAEFQGYQERAQTAPMAALAARREQRRQAEADADTRSQRGAQQARTDRSDADTAAAADPSSPVSRQRQRTLTARVTALGQSAPADLTPDAIATLSAHDIDTDPNLRGLLGEAGSRASAAQAQTARESGREDAQAFTAEQQTARLDQARQLFEANLAARVAARARRGGGGGASNADEAQARAEVQERLGLSDAEARVLGARGLRTALTQRLTSEQTAGARTDRDERRRDNARADADLPGWS